MFVEEPATDAASAKQAIKEARRMNMDLINKWEQLSPKEMACIIFAAEQIKGSTDDMKRVQPELLKMTKALKGLSGLKQKLSDAQMREMRKGDQSND